MEAREGRGVVLVYDGEGVGRRSLEHTLHSLRCHLDPAKHDVRRINAAGLAAARHPRRLATSWVDEAVLLVMPGGADIPYDRALRGAGNAQIRRFVQERGGHYLGVCAGGYYGCARVEFEKGSTAGLEVCEDRELGFFAGTARGAYFPGFAYASESGARAALLDLVAEEEEEEEEDAAITTSHTTQAEPDVGQSGRQAVVYYNGGCSFVGSDPACRPLAFYNNSRRDRSRDDDACDDDDVAIIECRVGKGKAILCGVHPEHDPRLLMASEASSESGDPHLRAILGPLLAGDHQRQIVFRSLLRRMGLSLSPDPPTHRCAGQ